MPDKAHLPSIGPASPQPRRFSSTRAGLLSSAAGVLLAAALGGAALAAGPTDPVQPQAVMLLTPGPIGKLQPDSPVAVKGSVAETSATSSSCRTTAAAPSSISDRAATAAMR